MSIPSRARRPSTACRSHPRRSLSRRSLLATVGAGLTTALAGCSQLSSSTSCSTVTPGAGDWPQVGHDARHTGADTTLPDVPAGGVHWRTDLGDDLDPAGVAVDGDKVVVGGRRAPNAGFLGQWSLGDGETLETTDLDARVTGPPVLTGDIVLVCCTAPDGTNTLRAYDRAWNEWWRRPRGGSHAQPTPTVAGSTVYGGDSDGTVFALDAADGTPRWERTFGDERQGGAVHAPVTVGDAGVYVPVASSREQGIYCLSPEDGQTRWQQEWVDVQSVMALTDDLLLVSYPSYEVAAFDAETGERRWSTGLDSRRISPPTVADDTVVVADETGLYGLDVATGKRRWKRTTDATAFARPVVAGDTVVAQTTDGLVGCSVSTGKRRWTVEESSGVPVVPVEHGFVFSPEPNALAVYTGCRS
ncbi:outer membrane protein assembly factor BamB family protein [Haloarchaeobius amylolyticus]|uniref:outer membrane protein assembly factor BamB family protein n=1 Tax=Haloarchaeobius amylolyticus TaxID=1198296 RepID=UPI00227015F1|nr:PQQ-binding-like beta-propeller repeat protein [Haloarchaeobius amylolyticus]